jgi:S-formylglutathione hydrolase FrmB
MEYFVWMVALWVDGIGLGQVPPALLGPNQIERVNRHLHGQIVAFTRQHGVDQRIWSPALQQRRDLLVYLPPGYDPAKKYPLAIFLHGAAQDEQIFLQTLVHRYDQAMAAGLLPPLIIAAPDGSIHGRATIIDVASFWADTRAGNFEQYLMVDVWNFLTKTFPIRPERESHALTGVSMGGSAAMALAIKHKDRFKTAIAMMQLLNLRYVDCKGHYRSSFDPECFALREKARGFESLGRRKLFCLRFSNLFAPLYGRGPEMVDGMSRINPLELLLRHDLKPGELNLYVGYGAKDEFNVAAQVESFLYIARQRGIEVTVECDPRGGHNLATGMRLLPGAMRWVAGQVPRGPSPGETGKDAGGR